MINPIDVYKIGRVVRTHGTRGEVEILFTDDPFERGTADYLVLDIDGILVPFFFQEWRYKGNETALFTFEDISNEKDAQPLVGRQVYYALSALPPEEEDSSLSSLKALTGFRAFRNKNGEIVPIGEIIEVDDSTLNVLLTIRTTDGADVLIPYHDDFLVDYSLSQRTIQLQLPDGLI